MADILNLLAYGDPGISEASDSVHTLYEIDVAYFV